MNQTHLATKRHGFLKSGKGAIALFSSILAIPMIGVGLLSFEAVNHYQVDVRLDRATANSGIFGGKQNYGSQTSLTPDDQVFLDTILRINMQDVIAPADLGSVTATPALGPENAFWFEVTSTYPYNTIYAALFDAGITEVTIGDSSGGGQFRVERQRIPTEYVLVLDASSSMIGRPLNTIRSGLKRFLDNALGQDGADPDDDPNVRISMVEFSENVNVGRRYKDELITLSSQKVPKRSSKRQAGYLIAKAFRYSNYLNKKGPEASRGGACVARKSNQAGTALIPMSSGDKLNSRYAKLLENPPKSEADKFDLLIAEGSYSGTRPGLGGDPWSYGFGPMCTNFEGFPGEPGYRTYGPKDAEAVNTAAGKTVLTIQRLPWNKRPNCVKNASNGDPFRNWVPWIRTHLWPNIQKDLAVSAYPGCAQPILIASNSKSELETYLDGYVGAWTTAADEGFAWGYRALHPNWRTVWNSDSSRTINAPGAPVPVPADFNAGVKKKFILFSDGFNNQRFFSIAQGDERNVRRFCQYLTGASPSSPRQRGDIEITIALTGAQLPGTTTYLRDHCASLPTDDHFLRSTSVDKIAEFLAKLGHPEYEVRFVMKPNSP